MKKVAIITFLLILAVIAFHFAVSHYPYNVVLITIDTLRADHLSCYNPAAARTPNIDNLAQDATLFERAYSLIPITLPAHTVMFTSHYPHEVKVFNNGDVFAYNVPVLTDYFRQKKYQTAAFISLGVLTADFGLGRAFEVYEDQFEQSLGRYYKTADEINKLALPWIVANKSKRFFAWLHYSDPHDPYVTVDAPPDTRILINGNPYGEFCLAKRENVILTFDAEQGNSTIQFEAITRKDSSQAEHHAKRFLDADLFITPGDQVKLEFGPEWEEAQYANYGKVRAFERSADLKLVNSSPGKLPLRIQLLGGIFREDLNSIKKKYQAEVAFVDRHVGNLIDALRKNGLYKNTIVVLTSDHGEGLRDHRILGHVNVLYEEVSHVPLIIRHPVLGRTGSRSQEIVNHLDLMPTLMDFLQLKNEKQMQGFSLKREVSRSPIDWLFAPSNPRNRTLISTFRPEARFNSFALIEMDRKLIYTPARSRRTWEYFDLKADRSEKQNLIAEGANPAQLKSLLEEFKNDAEASHSNRTAPALDESQQQMLKALGYVAGEED